MYISAKCTGATFSITGENRAEIFEGVGSFKYLGWVLYRSNKEWSEVCPNIWMARQVWGRLGKLLIRDGADPIVSSKFYCAVVQAVLLFGLETWVLTSAMLQKIEGVHVSFLRQVTWMKYQRLEEETCQQEGDEKLLQAAWTKPLWD